MIETPRKRFMKCFEQLCGKRHRYTVWSDLWQMYAIAIMNPVTKGLYETDEALSKVWRDREDRYLGIIAGYDREEVDTITEMFATLMKEFQENPFQDLAGQTYMELGMGNSNTGQFFTPYNVCQLMANITQGGDARQRVEERGWYTINDCACGVGATMIAALEVASQEIEHWQDHVLLMANDIDPLCCCMCYVQLSLIGASAIVTRSDALTKPSVDFYKEPESVWFTPQYLGDVWTQRRFWHGLDMNMRKGAGIHAIAGM